MSFLDDVVKIIEAPVNAGLDVITSVVDRTPGGGWIRTAFDQGQTWLVAMARDPWGSRVLWVISGGLSQAAATVVGPQLASLLWVLPDALRGECLSEAYVKEFASRLTMLLSVYGSQAVGDQVTKQVANLVQDTSFASAVSLPNVNAAKAQLAAAGQPSTTADALRALHLSPQEIAAKFNVRADAAALAESMVLCERVYDVSSFAANGLPPPSFTVPTGGAVPNRNPATLFLVPDPLPPGSSSLDVLLAILDYEKKGVPEDNLAALKAQYGDILKAEASGAAAPRSSVPAGQIEVSLGPPLTVQIGAPAALGHRLASLALLTAPAWAALLYVNLRGGFRS